MFDLASGIGVAPNIDIRTLESSSADDGHDVGATVVRVMYRLGHRESWFCAPQSCKEENSEAFAGQHANGSTSFYIVDEGSGVPTKTWNVGPVIRPGIFCP